jgi:HTH-type transcriptional regulator / antitoxin HigA
MELHTIKTEEEYNGAMAMIDSLINAPENSEDSEKLELFSIIVEDYENKYYKMDMPDPIEAIKQRVEQLGLTRKDLEQSLGSRARVSEILNKKRNLTLPMIRKLSKNLNIPADILIKETRREVA